MFLYMNYDVVGCPAAIAVVHGQLEHEIDVSVNEGSREGRLCGICIAEGNGQTATTAPMHTSVCRYLDRTADAIQRYHSVLVYSLIHASCSGGIIVHIGDLDGNAVDDIRQGETRSGASCG